MLVSFLLSDDAVSGRIARRDAYRTTGAAEGNLTDLRYVCHVERHDGQFVEVDAETLDHAETLATSIIRGWDAANTVAIRRVRSDGKLSPARKILDVIDRLDFLGGAV